MFCVYVYNSEKYGTSLKETQQTEVILNFVLLMPEIKLAHREQKKQVLEESYYMPVECNMQRKKMW